MARQRAPVAKARLEGRHIKNPQRYRQHEASAEAIGAAPRWLTKPQTASWRSFVNELPWLRASDRCLVGIASVLRARLESGAEVGTKSLGLLRLCLSSMGATPADASKISWSPDEESDDLLD